MAYEDELKNVVKAAVREALLEFREVSRQDVGRVVRETSNKLGQGGDAVLTTAEAASLCGVKTSTIWRWVREGRIEPLGGTPYRFRYGEVERARDAGSRTKGRCGVIPKMDVAAQADELVAEMFPAAGSLA